MGVSTARDTHSSFYEGIHTNKQILKIFEKFNFWIFQKSKEVGNFTKEYEITRRETQRFYYETWKEMKSFAQKHTQLKFRYSEKAA